MPVKVRLTRSGKIFEVFISTLQKYKEAIGICVLVTRPYQTFVRTMQDKGLDVQKMFVLDLCGYADASNVVCVAPADLTLLNLAVEDIVAELPPQRKFLVFESFSRLTVYNPPKLVAKFAIAFFKHLRALDVECSIIVAQDGLDAELLAALKQAADVIEYVE
ncbi:hypothetical protein J4211_01240 [Candidatus Woesearchaeota archaeon]|nr:hypothetical protein [Candidatus Woesearchaeota archaeon]